MNWVEKEVPNLELCKRLKRLGYPQEGGGWYYFRFSKKEDFELSFFHKETPLSFYGASYKHMEFYKAPTCRELGEWLPDEFFSARLGEEYVCANMEINPTEKDKYPTMNADTEPNVRAKMLIWLVENGYVKFEEGK